MRIIHKSLFVSCCVAACGKAVVREPLFVGGAVCAPCHEEQAALWSESHHDLAMQVARDETVLGDFSSTTFAHDGVNTVFSRRDTAFVVRTVGPDDIEHEFEIAYTFGVDPLQQYLIAMPGGRLQPLGVAWDNRPPDVGGQRWFHLFPDTGTRPTDPLHWTARAQTWNYMCAACHSTNVEKNYDANTDSYNTTWSDLDISCEACHGPGSNHVDWATQGSSSNVSPFGLTVHLADTSLGRWQRRDDERIAQRTVSRSSNAEIEVCAQCHSRRQNTTDTYQPAHGFLNGHRLALLDEGSYHADGQIQDEVYVYGSFLQSAMYMNGVTCSDCHDVHSLQTKVPGNGLCNQCHARALYDTPQHHFHPADSEGARCVECHMPTRTYMSVDERRDHSLRIPRPDLSVTIGTPNACTQCHADQSPQWAARAVRDWYGATRERHFGEVLHAARSVSATALNDLMLLASDIETPGIVRATALRLLGGYENVDFRSVIQAALDDSDPLVRFGAVQATEVLPPAERYAVLSQHLVDSVRMVRDEIGRVLAPVPATVLREADRSGIEHAVAGYLESQKTNADRPESQLNISNIFVAQHDLPAAESALQRALALDSAFVPAYVNLAELRRIQGRDIEGETILNMALARDPDNALASHALGLVLVRLGEAPRALPHFRRAAELAPENARFVYVYSVALNSLGQTGRATQVLEDAATLHPSDLDILRMLLSLDLGRKDIPAAIRHTREILKVLPNDADARELLRRLLQGEAGLDP